MQRLRSMGGPGFAEMCNGQDGHVSALCHFTQRLEHAAHLAVFMAVGPAEIGRHRVDDDQGNVAYLSNFAFQQFNVGLQIENALTFAVSTANGRDDMHSGLKSAPAAINRGTMVSAAPSS